MISYTDALIDLTLEQLTGFFVGWPNPPAPTTHLALLQGSDHVILARDDAAGRQVIGFITAITDGVLCAYIPLLEVLPAYQDQGIGTELVRRMLARLDHLYAIDLLCDEAVQPFYERLGLRRATGMLARNYARQAGV